MTINRHTIAALNAGNIDKQYKANLSSLFLFSIEIAEAATRTLLTGGVQ